MNPDHIWYCVGMRGKDIVKEVLNDCKTEEYARRLFIAMYGVDTIIHCVKPTISTLVFHIHHLKEEINRRVFDAQREMISDFNKMIPPKKSPGIKRAKRKHKRSKK